jgi:hypothetical protein
MNKKTKKKVHEFTIHEALSANGWPDKYLNWDKKSARIHRIRMDKAPGRFAFIPYSRWQRWTHPWASLRTTKIIALNTHIRFDLALIRNQFFRGSVFPTPEENFPYGRFLRIIYLGSFEFIILDKRAWNTAYSSEPPDADPILGQQVGKWYRQNFTPSGIHIATYDVLTIMDEVRIRTSRY